MEDSNDGSVQFRLHFEVKGLLHRKKLKIIKMLGGDCCDVFVFPVRKDGQPESVIQSHHSHGFSNTHADVFRFRPRFFLFKIQQPMFIQKKTCVYSWNWGPPAAL